MTTKRRGMTRGGVRRWKDFEREVVRALRKVAPGARRCLQFQRGHGVPDVAAYPMWLECKARQRVPVATVYQATAKAAKKAQCDAHIPAVVSKGGKRGPKLITLSLGDFLTLAAHSPKWKGARR